MPALVWAAGSASSIYLRANPDSIIADGKSVTTLSAEVRDSSGNTVADGTLVNFSTTLGVVASTATTTAGVARVRLTSDTTIGTALVSAWVTDGGAVAQIKIAYLAPGTELPKQSFITLASKSYLVYDPTTMLAYSSGGVTIYHRGLTIVADEVQFDLNLGIIKCRSTVGGAPITLTRGGKSLKLMLLCYHTGDMKATGLMESESGKIQRVSVRGADLAMELDAEQTPESVYDFVDMSESPNLIKSSSMTVRPGKDIQFRRAQIYVEGEKVLSMPLHVIALDTYQSQTSNYFGWGPTGLRIDLPFYYSLSPSSTGSLHLLRGQSSGWGYYSNGGWSLDMVEDYSTESGGEGTLALNRILWGDWGAHWNHTQQFDSGDRVYTWLDVPSHKEVTGSVNYSKQFTKASLGLNLYGNKVFDGLGYATTDLYLQSNPKRIINGNLNYAVLSKLSYTGGDALQDQGWGTGLQMQLFTKPFTLSRRSTLSSSVYFGPDWGVSTTGFTVLGNTSYNYRLGQAGSLGLIYSFTHGPGYKSLYGNHRLSANFLYSPSKKWRARLFSTYMLDADSSNILADVAYQITDNWRFGVGQRFNSSTFVTSDNKVMDTSSRDTEFALTRRLKDHEISLFWSTDEHQFQLGFDAARF